MSKTSKITVRHYLNTNVHPTYVLDKEDKDFPIYCRLSYKRKTISFRSFTGRLMTENEYDFYLKNGFTVKQKITLSDIPKDFTLNDELKYIDAVIKILQSENDEIDIFKKNFTDDLREYFDYAKKIILKVSWGCLNISFTEETYNSEPSAETKRLSKIYSKNDKKPSDFANILNSENTLLENIRNLQSITKIDISSYFNSDTILFWEVVELILKEYNDKPIIDLLVYSNIEKITEICKKGKLSISKENIKKSYNILIYNILEKLKPFPF